MSIFQNNKPFFSSKSYTLLLYFLNINRLGIFNSTHLFRFIKNVTVILWVTRCTFQHSYLLNTTHRSPLCKSCYRLPSTLSTCLSTWDIKDKYTKHLPLRDSYLAPTSKPLVSKITFLEPFFNIPIRPFHRLLHHLDDIGSPPVWHLNCRQDTCSIGFPLNSSNEWISRSFPLYIRHRTYLKTRSRPIFNNP